ncbi:abortive infection family protein [Serinicoccus sediminis]|uniref:abortive infection family protein n=1 Tax=Serinicoccus sediminis TaxID=2306021 RepID=UPI003B510DCF
MLESVAKFVLEETGIEAEGMKDFGQLWHIARERLGVLPQQVDPDLAGASAIRKVHQSTWSIAEQVNELRNLQGTGHGRTLPTGVSEELALLVVREALTVAEYMLDLLDRYSSA